MSNPDHKSNPADAGWTYQGSNAQSRVDFYEKDGCKMDYYPTTGVTFFCLVSLRKLKFVMNPLMLQLHGLYPKCAC